MVIRATILGTLSIFDSNHLYLHYSSLDTYMSHEGILYCKPHHRELFQPKVVVREHDEVQNTRTQEAIGALPHTKPS